MAGLVKHYQNDMQGIPQLTNAWGCMINLLDAVLITGFNFRPVLGLSKASTESLTATISLATGHGFIARQVVRIKDSSNGWDGDFKVLSITATSIIVECLASHPTTISGTAQVFTSPLDWEIAFSTEAGSAEPKRAYRSKSPDSLGLILLVHDFCVSGATVAGAKFAKVGLVSSMSDIDTITGTQMPYDASAPNANWGWDGAYHGWVKWYYAAPLYGNDYDQRTDSNAPSTYNRTMFMVGDDESFVFNVYEWMLSAMYGVTEFHDETYNGKNACLLATGVNGAPIAQSTAMYAGGRNGYAWVILLGAAYGVNSYNQRGLLWFNTAGVAEATVLGPLHFAGSIVNSTNVAFSASPPSTNQHAFTQEYVVDASMNVRGILPFLRKPLRFTNEVVTTTDGKHLVRAYQGRGCYRQALCLESR